MVWLGTDPFPIRSYTRHRGGNRIFLRERYLPRAYHGRLSVARNPYVIFGINRTALSFHRMDVRRRRRLLYILTFRKRYVIRAYRTKKNIFIYS